MAGAFQSNAFQNNAFQVLILLKKFRGFLVNVGKLMK